MLDRVTNVITKTLSMLCGLAIAGLTLIVFLQVFSRFIKYSLPGTEELARLLVVWLTFLGTSLAIHEKMHLGVRYFVGLASEKYQKIIDFTIHVLLIIFFGILMTYGFKLTIAAMATSSSTLQLPMGVFYGVIPLSSIFSIYYIIMNMLKPSEEGVAEL
ncbi:TRAP transporter small permease [Bacillus sp. FJAT-29937]|uniref:TRAP transporter small permease n=1 Tax=Bacillus sp. FJAT-29937 TaxID=1720553 RepID=UPI000835365A|nr:TRAP transporter small permease [Bacillus sp. FJAT-29937]